VHFLIAGASGFLGTHLTRHLRERGHEVTRLVRREATAPDESTWDPYTERYDQGLVDGADVVVNLAGAPTAGNPHSKAWARELRDSRVTTTRVLAHAVAGSDHKPAFLAGAGISIYGDHGDEVLTEQSDSRGSALLTKVAREWEAAAAPARDAGARVCVLRTAPVMDKDSAPLKQMRLAWSLGLGARLGDGRQRFPMISRRDWTGAAVFLAEHEAAAGAFNLCCPHTPTNAELTAAVADAVHRKAFLRAPRKVLELAAGPMAPELLGSVNARPAALLAAGYRFRDRTVDQVVAAALRG
jgi:hypothetical protein